MKNILGTIFIVVYSIVAIAVTVLLLSYNEYMCSEINGYTFYIVNDDSLEPEFLKGDLLIINQSSFAKINVGDNAFFYQNLANNDFMVKYGEITDISRQSGYTIYTVDGQQQFESSYLIGKEEGSYFFHNIGTILGMLESRWGYLFCVVIVTLLLFLEELYELYMEIKYINEISEAKEGK